MELEEAAKLIDGKEYGEEITDSLEQELKESGIVLFTGYSDDIASIHGAIRDESSGDMYFMDGKLFNNYEPFEDIESMIKWLDDRGINFPERLLLVQHSFDGEHNFKTKAPFIPVTIMEDGEVFSNSILVYKEDLWDE